MLFQIEFLPVYKPTEAEIDDPRVYASNVRLRMATRLGIPMVDRSVNEWRPNFEKSTENLSSSQNDLREEVLTIERAPAYVVDFVGNMTQMWSNFQHYPLATSLTLGCYWKLKYPFQNYNVLKMLNM